MKNSRYIRNFLGHESVQTTEIYLRISQNSVSKILQERKIENLIPKVEGHPASEKGNLPDFLMNAR